MTPKYIREECTEEELVLLLKSRTKRMKRLSNPASVPSELRRVSPQEFYRKSDSLSVGGVPVRGLAGIRPRTVVRKPD